MGLKEYQRRRDFTATPEPAALPARKSPASDRIFVVQKHAATSLHYDLRLRIGDVLKSWAVPKGPSFDPREKRLAVEVEDHPLEYASFEGTIPEGQYGAGAVMIWDHGRWSPVQGDPLRSLKDGELKFDLEGERLKGRWVLVRTNYSGKQPQWLLIKERDREASPGIHAETFATSVTTGRTMDEIAAGAPAVGLPKKTSPTRAPDLTGARKAPMPSKLKPQLAQPAEHAPDGNDWLHEVKFDGYRLLIFRKGDSVTIRSRNGLDWTSKLPDIAAAVQDRLRVDAILDGEAVLLDARGVSDFQALQNAIHNRRARSIVVMAFDLPWCDGHDLTAAPLHQRRALLAELLGPRQEGRLRFSEHIVGNGPAAYERVCAAGLEGIVSKNKSSPYAQSRTPSWVKVKCFNQQEFVIGGLSAPEGTREEFGALLIGYYTGRDLHFAGKVGTGFSTETLRSLATRLKPLARTTPAFVNPPTGADARGVTWVRPELVAQVQFRDWTGEGVIRHPSFRGLRDDIDPASVVREAAQAPTQAPTHTKAAPTPPPPTSRLTSPDRIVYPDRGAGYTLTKRQLSEYYQAVAPRMLPHVVNRPLSILRCPDGEGGPSFFQKHPAKGMPAAVDGIDIRSDDGTITRHLCIRDLEGLLGLVQMSVLEFHPWGSPAEDPESPDRLIFDLDPGAGVTWRQIVDGAIMVRDAMAQAKLRGFARLSGGKGIHVVVPLRRGHTWEQAKTFSRAAAEALVKLAPRRFVATPGAPNREGRIFIDFLRNARGATAIASYSTRARPGAPIALPVAWDELAGLETAHAFGIPAVLRRLAASPPDPWKSLASSAGKLPNLTRA